MSASKWTDSSALDRGLNVFHVTLIHPRLKPASPHHNQAGCYVAAATQKRATELFETTPQQMRDHGGGTGQKAVIAMCRAEPEVVFVQFSHDTFARLSEIDDPTKRIVLDMEDVELWGTVTEHAGFGNISAMRVSGEQNLFMVDYPQGHFIALEISGADLRHSGATDRVMPKEAIIRVALSEVQWARMISSMNSGGVPCTLQRYYEPATGAFLTPKLPEKHAADIATFKDNVKARVQKATAGVRQAEKALEEIMKGPLRKGDLAQVQEMLRAAGQQMESNVPYVVETAEENIDTAVGHAKAEVDAHVDYAMQRLGERALGARLQQALAGGVNVSEIGRNVIQALAAPSEEDA